MSPLATAQHYFNLSNESDLDSIAKLFTDKTTYRSQTTGEYVGVKDILAMQQAFRDKFISLHWKVNSVKAIKPGIILFDYDFVGKMPSGEVVNSSGLEYVTVENGKILQVEIRNKT